MKFSIAIIGSLFAVGSAATISTTTESTMKAIMNDLSKIGTQFKNIDDTVNAFPASGVNGENQLHQHDIAIHDLFDSLITSINNLPMPISAENAKKIIQTYQTFTTIDVHSISGIASKHADFVAISAASTVQADLAGSSRKCANLEAALQPITPADMVGSLAATFTQIDTVRSSAIAIFSS